MRSLVRHNIGRLLVKSRAVERSPIKHFLLRELGESKDGKNFYDFEKELAAAYSEDEEENQTLKYFNYGK